MTQRTAHMDLDWEMVDGPAMTYWLAELPAIPGYPDSAPDVADGGAIAEVFPGSAMLGGYTFFLSIAVPDNGQCVLTNEDFHIPNADTAEEAMGEVESLSLEEISDKVAESGYAPTDTTASRKPRHAMRRTASMNLDWFEGAKDIWQADNLPAIPGYTPWSAVFTIFLYHQGGDAAVNVNCWDIPGFDPIDDTAEAVMQAIDNLDVYDISNELKREGYEPMVDEDGEYVVASRRTAHMDLDWVSVDDSYIANMPDIPGYKFDPVQSFVSIDTEFGPTWECIFNIDGLDNVPESAAFMRWDDGVMSVWITSHDLGIRNTHTAQEMMDIIENLSPEDIAQELMNLGIEPVND